MASDVGGIRFHGTWNPATGSDVLFCRFVGGHAPYTIWRLDRPTGVEQEVVPHGCCGNYDPAYAPDGRRFAYTGLEHSESGDVFVAGALGAGARRITCESGWEAPAWSPDGSALVAVRASRRPLDCGGFRCRPPAVHAHSPSRSPRAPTGTPTRPGASSACAESVLG